MRNLFSNLGIASLDFVQISASFLVVMLLVFNHTTRRHFWTNFVHVVFALQCLLIIIFRADLTPRFFAALMLFSTVIIRVILARRTDNVSNRLRT
ncbi:MAG: hypothetical protein LC794_01580 [Acidobacteria bacterium]|nr:hypothetical protein [Acidobacteriota bacterium]